MTQVNTDELRERFALKEFGKIGEVYWFAKNPYTLECARYFNDEFDRQMLQEKRAFPTYEEGLMALCLAHE